MDVNYEIAKAMEYFASFFVGSFMQNKIHGENKELRCGQQISQNNIICEILQLFTVNTVFISVIVYHVLTQLTILFFKNLEEKSGRNTVKQAYFLEKSTKIHI